MYGVVDENDILVAVDKVHDGFGGVATGEQSKNMINIHLIMQSHFMAYQP